MHITLGISLLLLSAVLHAVWNFLAKRAKTHSKEFFLFANTIGIALCLPVLFFTPFQSLYLPHDIFLYLIFSGLFESFYFTTLAKCYKHGDLSITYPIARTFPIIFVTLFCHVIAVTLFSSLYFCHFVLMVVTLFVYVQLVVTLLISCCSPLFNFVRANSAQEKKIKTAVLNNKRGCL